MVSTPPTAPASPDSDALLVERAVNGDTRAFEMLVIKYQRRVERLVARMVRDVDLVPDITQETFIRAYRAWRSFEATLSSTHGSIGSLSIPPKSSCCR